MNKIKNIGICRICEELKEMVWFDPNLCKSCNLDKNIMKFLRDHPNQEIKIKYLKSKEKKSLW